ncbi:MAG: hypothetical protein PVF05_08470 [Gemmatimonadales bacterium]
MKVEAIRKTLKLGVPLVVAAALAPIVMGAAVHITPTVVIQKQADVIRATLPADAYFVRTVKVGKEDMKRIEEAGGVKLKDPEVKFYVGKSSAGEVQGVVLFPQVNTQHGPLEVGLTLAPDGTLSRAIVTKATVETKPWILEAVKTGFLDEFQGAPVGQRSSEALAKLEGAKPGKLPEYMGKIALRAVDQGAVLYTTLYGTDGS